MIFNIIKPIYAREIINPVLSNQLASVDPKAYFNDVIAAIISMFFIVGIIYFFWHIIFAGYHLIGSDGDPKKFESAKNEITYSVLGLIVVFTIFGVLKFVGIVLGITNLENLSITWPTL